MPGDIPAGFEPSSQVSRWDQMLNLLRSRRKLVRSSCNPLNHIEFLRSLHRIPVNAHFTIHASVDPSFHQIPTNLCPYWLLFNCSFYAHGFVRQ